MAIIVCQIGALRLTVKYVIPWKDGIFYYQRRVPEDMSKHHLGKSHIRKSLKTRDALTAAKEAAKLASEQVRLSWALKLPRAGCVC
jgi:hypothetical protein